MLRPCINLWPQSDAKKASEIRRARLVSRSNSRLRINFHTVERTSWSTGCVQRYAAGSSGTALGVVLRQEAEEVSVLISNATASTWGCEADKLL